jgi:anti-sigma B factor antagonist
MIDRLRGVWDGLAPHLGSTAGRRGLVSQDAERFGADVLHVEASQDRTGATIVLEGEFDMTGTETFRAVTNEALAAGPRSITIDASGLEFIDSSGLLALMRAREAAGEAGVAFRVSDPSPALRRLVELAGIEGLLPGV